MNTHHVLSTELDLGNTAPALMRLRVGWVYKRVRVLLEEEGEGFTETWVLTSRSNFKSSDSWKNQTIG